MILECRDMFSKADDDIQFCPRVQHRTNLENDMLFKFHQQSLVK